MQIFTIGMHRSGTSCATRLLNLMGIYFAPEGSSLGHNWDNPKGFWERRDIVDLNEKLLASIDCQWDQVNRFSLDKIPEKDLAIFSKKAKRLILEMDAHRPWVIKDPRMCLFYPLWKPLTEVPIVVRVNRDPLEIAQSLSTRNNIPIPVGLALWESYISHSLSELSFEEDIFLDYNALMLHPFDSTESLYKSLISKGVTGIKMPSRFEIEAFIEKGLYHESLDQHASSSFLTGHQKKLSSLNFIATSNHSISEVSQKCLEMYENEKSQTQRLELQRKKISELKTAFASESKRVEASQSDLHSKEEKLKNCYHLIGQLQMGQKQLHQSVDDILERLSKKSTGLDVSYRGALMAAQGPNQSTNPNLSERMDFLERQFEDVKDTKETLSLFIIIEAFKYFFQKCQSSNFHEFVDLNQESSSLALKMLTDLLGEESNGKTTLLDHIPSIQNVIINRILTKFGTSTLSLKNLETINTLTYPFSFGSNSMENNKKAEPNLIGLNRKLSRLREFLEIHDRINEKKDQTINELKKKIESIQREKQHVVSMLANHRKALSTAESELKSIKSSRMWKLGEIVYRIRSCSLFKAGRNTPK